MKKKKCTIEQHSTLIREVHQFSLIYFLLQLFCFGVFRTRSRCSIETSQNIAGAHKLREKTPLASSTIALYFLVSFIKFSKWRINKQIAHILWIIKSGAFFTETYHFSSAVIWLMLIVVIIFMLQLVASASWMFLIESKMFNYLIYNV